MQVCHVFTSCSHSPATNRSRLVCMLPTATYSGSAAACSCSQITPTPGQNFKQSLSDTFGVVAFVCTNVTGFRAFTKPSDLRTTRARLLEMFTDVTCNPEMMKNATDAYLSLLQGMVHDVGCKM